MKNILIIATSFPPIGDRNCERVIKFCKYLPEFGYDPFVLTISKGSMRVFDHSLEDELDPALKIYRVSFPALSRVVSSLGAHKGPLRFVANFIKRNLFIPDDKIAWVIPAALKGRLACRKNNIGLILSSAPSFSSHLAAFLVKKMTKCRWVADYRDLWTGNPNYKIKSGFRRKVEVYLDRLIVKNADAIITVSDEWKAFIERSFLDGESGKVFVIPNGYDLSDFADITPKFGRDDKFIISHTGVIIPSYPMDELFEAIAELDKPIKERTRLNLFGYIYADHKKRLEDLSRRLRLENIVRFGGSIPRKEALKVQKESDVLLLMYSGYGENVKGMIPSKAFDYIAAGKPILALLPECGAADIIRKGNCGMLIEPNDAKGITVSLSGIYNARHNKAERNYNWNYLKQFERKEQVKALTDILNNISIGKLKNKILMIATDFPPDPSVGRLRTVKFCKYLPEFGWQPVVLAPSYRYFWGRDESLLKEIPAEIKVYRAFFPALVEIAVCLITGKRYSKTHQEIKDDPKTERKDKVDVKRSALSLVKSFNRYFNVLLIPDRYILWLPFAFIKGLRINAKEKVDFIYTSIPANSLVLLGYFLKKVLRKKWIIDYRDLWTGDHTRSHSHPIRKKIGRFLERSFASKADIIITTSKQKAEYLKLLLSGLDSSRIFCITNGFDYDDYPPMDSRERKNGKWVITYTGRLYRSLSAVPFISGLGLAIQDNPALRSKIKVRFVGDIFKEEKEKIDSLIERHDFHELIEFVGYVSYRDALRYQLNSDMLLLIMGDAENADGVIPTKIFEYLGSRKPILAIVPRGAAEDIINNTGSGISVLPNDTKGIKEAILRIYKDSLNGGSGFLSDNVDRFSRKNLAKEVSTLLSGIYE